MKFQDSSFNGLKVIVGTKSVTHPCTHPPTHAPTHAPKAICPINFFKVGGIKSIPLYGVQGGINHMDVFYPDGFWIKKLEKDTQSWQQKTKELLQRL